jgi:2-polyprenyl-6-hydroxyphenyl methylase/3-demethylubiquinone-9 3-methyltransferase
MFIATLNRTIKSYLLAIIGAEYILNWLPKGTHNWKKFVTPAEIARNLRQNHLSIIEFKGMQYNILSDKWELNNDLSVNYLTAAVKNHEHASY